MSIWPWIDGICMPTISGIILSFDFLDLATELAMDVKFVTI